MAITNSDGSIVLETKVDQSGLRKGMSTMRSGVSSLNGSLGKLGKTIAAVFSVRALIKFGAQASNLATEQEASIQRLIDIYGSASKTVGDFIDANAQALGMSRAAAASYASVYGNLFSGWADQATNAKLTNAYLNMTAVVASKTGRTVEDVQERIRSGLLGNTEAIEDLGVFVNVKTIEMTDAFQRMADGKSWEQLDAYTQQQIRTFAILEQATGKYGNEVAQTSALAKSQFQAAWQDFQATWGQVVNKVLVPILETLTEILVTATAAMQSLLGISRETISESDAIENAANNQGHLTDEIKKTEKAAKKAFARFDDIEVLTSNISENVGGTNSNSILGNLELPQNPIPDDAVEDSWIYRMLKGFAQFAERIADAFSGGLNGGLSGLGNALGMVFDKMQNMTADEWEELFTAIADGIVAIVLIKITTSVITSIINFAKAIGSIITVIMAHPYASLVVALGAVLTLLSGIAEYNYSKSSIGKLADEFAQVRDNAKEAREAAQQFIDDTKSRLGTAETDFKALDVIAEKYYELSQKATYSDEDLNLLEYYYNFLTEHGVDLTRKIDEVTKAYKGTREELNKMLELTFQRIVLEAVSEDLKEAIKQKIDLQNSLAELQEQEAKTLEELRQTTKEGAVVSVGPNLFSYLTDPTRPEKKKAALEEQLSGINEEIEANIAATEELDKLISNYANIIATGGKSYTNEIVGGLESVGNTTVDPDFSPIMRKLEKASDGADDLYGKFLRLNAISMGIDTTKWAATPSLKIPGLAKGAVLPANKPFLAMLGDQKHGTNIEAPLQTIVDAFNIALAQNGGYNGGGNTEVVLEIDGREFGRAVVEQGNRENRRIGTRLVIA